MLIETLAEMAFNAGAERVSLEIRPATQNSGSVVVLHDFGTEAFLKADENGKGTLAILAQPLVVNGAFGDMDQRVVALVDDVSDDIVSASASLPDTDARVLRDKLKVAAKPKADVDETKEVAASTEGVEGSDETESKEDVFANGEAGSL